MKLAVRSPSASRFGYVRGVGFVESSDAVYIATHNGLYTVPGSLDSPKESASLGGPIAGLHQDNMGFTIDGERMYASGHPDPIVSTDANLGLVFSTGQGKSWSAVSLKTQLIFTIWRSVIPARGRPQSTGVTARTL